MKILQVDKETFRILGDSLSIKDKLPTGTYEVEFSPMGGFSLVVRKDFKVTEKLYSNVEERINKVIKGYQNYNRSLGIIFSGDKGIGKSLASQLLCQKMIGLGLPVILVNNTEKSIINFLSSIDQECVFLFDEFEKNYHISKERVSDSDYLTQDDFLSFFDGTSYNIKHLFIVTCNEIEDLSPYLINRPGRFHYHIRWTYPSTKDITEYLQDNLDKSYWGEIDKVCTFSNRMPLNYDCLRSISFELSLGVPFEEAIETLNILKYQTEVLAKVTVETKGGAVYIGRTKFDMFDKGTEEVRLTNKSNGVSIEEKRGYCFFYPSNLIFKDNKILLDADTTVYDFNNSKDEVKEATLKIVNDSYNFVL